MEHVLRGLPLLAICAGLTTGCAGLERRWQKESPSSASVEDTVPPAKPSLRGSTGPHPAQSEAAAPRAAERPAAPPARATPPARTQQPAPAVVKPQPEPPLDLRLLESRLRATTAIGAFSKIALKYEIEDLLERFRAFYQGRIRTTLVELRRAFDLLVMKALVLLQDADPALARALVSSRESIWGVLSDPVKLNAL